MKGFITLAYLFMQISYLYCQNYNLFNTNNEYHYVRKYGQNDVIHSLKIDSSSLVGLNTRYYNYKQILFDDSEYAYGNFYLSNKCISRSSWFGEYIEINPDENYLIFNSNLDTIHVNKFSQPGDEWVFFTTWNKKYIAKHIETIESDVIGTLDSIKKIQLKAFDLSNNQLINDIFNNKTFLISKNHGIVRTFSFYEFPTDTVSYKMVGNQTNGIKPLLDEEYFKFKVNDYIVYSNNQNVKEFINVNQSDSLSNTYNNTISKFTNQDNLLSTTSIIHNFLYDSYHLTGEFSYFEPENNNFVFVNYINQDIQYLKGVYYESFDNEVCWPNINYTNYPNFIEHTKHFTYAKNIGIIYNSDVATFNDGFDEWGNEIITDITTSKTLLTYRSLFNNDYGSNVSPFTYLQIYPDKYQSCDGKILFQIENNTWLDSVNWNFGDGIQSNQISVNHTYTNEGYYSPSVYLNSIFGDTTINFDVIQVGNVLNDNEIWIESKMYTCNQQIFVDRTENVNNRLWILPNGTTSTEDTITYIFDEIDTFQLQLSNEYAYCYKNTTIDIPIYTLQSPIINSFPLIDNGNYSFSFFEMGNQSLPNSTFGINNPANDDFLFGCNKFTFTEGDSVITRISLNDVYYYEVSPGAFDYDYYGINHTLWVDYNNNASFETNEKLEINCLEMSQPFYPVINSYSKIFIPYNSIKNTALRMRLVAGDNPNITSGYDFSMIIQGELKDTLLNSNFSFDIYPNPTSELFTIKLNKYFTGLYYNITSIDGRKMSTNLLTELNNNVDITYFSEGIYIVEMFDSKNNLLDAKKIIKN